MTTATAALPAPFGSTTIYLLGSMNARQVDSAFALAWDGQGYVLDLKLRGMHDFQLASADGAAACRFGAHRGGRSTPAIDHALPLACAAQAEQGMADLSFIFGGEQRLRLHFEDGRAMLTLSATPSAEDALPVTEAQALALRFDSRSPRHKQPFGAVPAGTTVQYTVQAEAGVEAIWLVVERRRLEGNQELLEYLPHARVPLREAGHGQWQCEFSFDEVLVYGYHFEAVVNGQTYVLHNNTDVVPWTRERGSFGHAVVAHQPAQPQAIRRLRQTVFQPDFQVPHWAADAVYYYIFPERFRNGNPANDPRPGVARYQDHDIQFHADWLERPHKPHTGDGSDDIYNNDFFGGDLQGIIDKLDHIAALGANVVYLTPLFQAASNHKYDTADYHRIDPAFGSNEDFERLCSEAAQRGLRVVIDASLNHVGSDSIYFNRYGNHGDGGAFRGGRPQPGSPYFGWFQFEAASGKGEARYRGWVGVDDLPELDKNHTGWREFAYGAEDSVTRRWLQRGAGGWRMDVAPWVPDDFWREWRAVVKATRPDAITIAETWFDASKHLLGDCFDSTMNYIFRNTVLDYANGGDARRLYPAIELVREAYPPQAFHALMNLISSHDQARALHCFGHHGDGSDAATVARAKQRLRLATLFQMVFPGAPSIYYGDEVGVTGGDDPYNRGTYPWADCGGRPDDALRAEFTRLVHMRHRHPVLRRGSLDAPLHLDEHVIVLLRRLDDTWALSATNNAELPQTVDVALPAEAPALWVCALGGPPVQAHNGRLQLQVPALFGRVLLSG